MDSFTFLYCGVIVDGFYTAFPLNTASKYFNEPIFRPNLLSHSPLVYIYIYHSSSVPSGFFLVVHVILPFSMPIN